MKPTIISSKSMCRIILFTLISVFTLLSSGAQAFWVWTPESGKWINPKHAVKETPQAQFEVGRELYEVKDYDKAMNEFDKLIEHYPLSRYAAESQYYIGLIYEAQEEYYKAYESYQLIVSKYPYSDRLSEIIEREYRIGNLFFTGTKKKVFGMELIPSLDEATDIFQDIVKNAPYGPYADLAQYKLGLTYQKLEEFPLAEAAFKKLISDYPDSELVDDAQYQIALSKLNNSLGPGYDEGGTEEAAHEFMRFKRLYPNSEVAAEADDALKGLREKQAQQAYDIAQFYEKQKKVKSAIIYYQEVADEYPESSWAAQALDKIVALEKEGSVE